ncbi:MAG: glycosyltransferase [bacterium]|nr:glycosyltransferase [bacterium]
MKVCVYAISKNEEKFVKKWVNSMKEADDIYVLDTGSTDNTVSLLKEAGVHVYSEVIFPWRFDVARNKSLDLVPKDCDICVCTDFDEVFESGWREKIENAWNPNTTRFQYTYHWSLDNDDQPIVSFFLNQIHKRDGYQWTHPVHEVLSYSLGDEVVVTCPDVVLKHYPDLSKSRSSYLPLLELSVAENPDDDRNMHYLGREYMYYKMWDKSIETLKKHLTLPKAIWKDERAASMRFIGRCYKNLKNYDEARCWYDLAAKEAPHLRDAFVEKALMEYELENYKSVEDLCFKALEIKSHEKTYINEPFSWDSTIYDLLSISAYHLQRYSQAIYFVDIALTYLPNDERLLNNRKIFKEKESSF